jgi:hypothetical protein
VLGARESIEKNLAVVNRVALTEYGMALGFEILLIA